MTEYELRADSTSVLDGQALWIWRRWLAEYGVFGFPVLEFQPGRVLDAPEWLAMFSGRSRGLGSLL